MSCRSLASGSSGVRGWSRPGSEPSHSRDGLAAAGSVISSSADPVARFTLYTRITSFLLSAFIRNPTLRVGEPYLLAPIAAAVLGGTAVTGGIGSMVAVAGAALFLTQLGQVLKMLGLSSAIEFVIEGIAIVIGMAVVRVNFPQLVWIVGGWRTGKAERS